MQKRGKKMFFTGLGLILSGMLLALLSMIPSSIAKRILSEEYRGEEVVCFNLSKEGSLVIMSRKGYVTYTLTNENVTSGTSRSLFLKLMKGSYRLKVNGSDYIIRVEEGSTRQPYLIFSVPAFLITVIGASIALRFVGAISLSRGDSYASA